MNDAAESFGSGRRIFYYCTKQEIHLEFAALENVRNAA